MHDHDDAVPGVDYWPNCACCTHEVPTVRTCERCGLNGFCRECTEPDTHDCRGGDDA